MRLETFKKASAHLEYRQPSEQSAESDSGSLGEERLPYQ